MRRRTRLALWSIALLAVAGSAAAWMLSAPRPAFSEADAARLEQPGDPERGRLVFAAGDCASCHASPGQHDRLRLGGGMALSSPFGMFRVPNISPDPEVGIGRWRTINLANALMSGVAPSGQHLYPALPYTSYAHMKVEDVRDLMAFLRTLPSVPDRPPPHELVFPFTIRRGIGLWKLVYFDRAPIVPDPGRDAAWNRGRYVVEALGHCAECHSTRNLLAAIPAEQRFAGGPDQEGIGFIPNLTPTHLSGWSKQDLVGMLTTGFTPDLRFVGSSMADVVTDTAMLPDSDRDAIATYIESLPARPTPPPS
ncbi:MAG: cycG [Rhodospirillales bacterium]|nr:cycG [Rhodospirillales bacterium]